MARFLALDWDHQQLHLVAATITAGSVRIQRAAVWQESQSPNPIEPEALGQLLRERMKSAGIAPAPVLACIGRERTILKEVRYPLVPPAEEPALIKFQALRDLNDPPEEVVLDYAPTTDSARGGEQRAMAMILRREMLLAYQAICRAAGCKLIGLTPRPFGTAACLKPLLGTSVLTPSPEPSDAAVAILTATDKWAEFCVARGETVLFARSLAAGPALAGEVRRNLAVYTGGAPQNPAKALYIAGAGELAALRDRLQEMLGIPVHPFDPFAGVEKPELPATGRGSFAAAVGLLYAHADRRGLPINFVKPKQPRPPKDPNKRRLLIAASLSGLLVLGGISFCYATLAEKDREIDALFMEKKALDTQLVQLEEDAKRVKALDDWNQAGIVWLDELYDLTDRFPDPNTIRLVQLTADPLQRSAKDKHVAKMALKGITTTEYQAVDTLISRLVEDGHYRVDPKQLSRNQTIDRFRFPQAFQTRVDIEKQPPGKFTRRLPLPPPPEEEAEAGRGRRGAGNERMMEMPFQGGQQ